MKSSKAFLRLRQEQKLEDDHALNSAPEVVQLTASSGVRRAVTMACEPALKS